MQQASHLHVGPIPDAGQLERYEAVVNGAADRIIGMAEVQPMERIRREVQARHSWYVGLVVRSKMADVLRGDETDADIAAMLTLVKGPWLDGWHWLLWEGRRLIGWRYPQLIRDAIRITDDGAHMATFVEYMR